MRRMTTDVTMVARCRVDSVHVLTKNSVATYANLCQHSSCLPWQCQFGCEIGGNRPLSSFVDLLLMAVLGGCC